MNSDIDSLNMTSKKSQLCKLRLSIANSDMIYKMSWYARLVNFKVFGSLAWELLAKEL